MPPPKGGGFSFPPFGHFYFVSLPVEAELMWKLLDLNVYRVPNGMGQGD